MNRYSLFITTGSGDKYDEWKFTVLAEDNRNFVMQCILETKKEFKCESPVELMDLVCDMYGWKWEDFTPDMEIEF